MPNILEIRVYDTVTAYDTLLEVQQAVDDIIQKWYVSDDDKPLTITISKMTNRGPPVLKIFVNDLVDTKTGLV
jgi:hypothetical protein